MFCSCILLPDIVLIVFSWIPALSSLSTRSLLGFPCISRNLLCRVSESLAGLTLVFNILGTICFTMVSLILYSCEDPPTWNRGVAEQANTNVIPVLARPAPTPDSSCFFVIPRGPSMHVCVGLSLYACACVCVCVCLCMCVCMYVRIFRMRLVYFGFLLGFRGVVKIG